MFCLNYRKQYFISIFSYYMNMFFPHLIHSYNCLNVAVVLIYKDDQRSENTVDSHRMLKLA